MKTGTMPMDWKTFVVNMTNAMIWPMVVGSTLLLFRHTFRHIAERLLSIKFRDFEFAFGDQAGKIAENIESAALDGRMSQPEDNRLSALAEKSPRAAILETWLRVEVAIRELALAHEIPSEKVPPLKLIQLLHERGNIDRNTMQSLRGLMSLRNLAVHAVEADLTTQKALDFIALANAIRFVLSTKM